MDNLTPIRKGPEEVIVTPESFVRALMTLFSEMTHISYFIQLTDTQKSLFVFIKKNDVITFLVCLRSAPVSISRNNYQFLFLTSFYIRRIIQ